MDKTTESTPMAPAVAAAVASCSLAIPLAMSLSSVPSPNHPLTLLWYKALREPRFKPPDWAFPVAWTAIELSLARAAYRLLRAPPSAARRNAIGLWGANILMIGGWSQLFFKRRNLGASTVAAAGLVATSVAFVVESKKVDKSAARAGIPLVAWVAFATVLTGTIWQLNRRR